MKLLIDMNLSPHLVTLLNSSGWETSHWSTLGDPRATDHTLMDWAQKNGFSVITHDLDFGDILAATNALCPSVIQVRTQDVSPEHLLPIILTVLQQYKSHLESGALISVDEVRSRVRVLPIRQQ